MVSLGGRQHKLAEGRENKSLAEKKFHQLCLMATEPAESPDARVAAICEEFLAWSESRQARSTYLGYQFYIQAFCEGCGFLRAAQLKPFHVTRWIAKKSWNETTQYNALRTVFRVFNWAKTQGLLWDNPLRGMERPRPKARPRCLTDEEYRRLLGGAHGQFRILLFALRQTGARPSELCRLSWNQVQGNRCIYRDHKTAGKTDKPRIIYLTSPMVRLLDLLRRTSTAQHVFLNKLGKPWTSNAIRLQVQRIKKKLNMASDVCAYMLRHTFATKALLNGVDVATVAELLGHVDTTMVCKVYLHLANEIRHMETAAERAIVSALGKIDVRAARKSA
jgi:integrase